MKETIPHDLHFSFLVSIRQLDRLDAYIHTDTESSVEMGRRPCCEKEGLKRGAWTPIEDQTLIDNIKVHGEGRWRNLPKRAADHPRN